jgi:hypothetical protein
MEELMDRLGTHKTSMSSAKARYYKLRDDQMKKRADLTRTIVAREQRSMLDIMKTDSVDKLQKDINGLIEHISKATKEQVNFHTQSSMF